MAAGLAWQEGVLKASPGSQARPGWVTLPQHSTQAKLLES